MKEYLADPVPIFYNRKKEFSLSKQIQNDGSLERGITKSIVVLRWLHKGDISPVSGQNLVLDESDCWALKTCPHSEV